MSSPNPVATPATSAPPASPAPLPTAAQVATAAVNAQLISNLLDYETQLQADIAYLQSAATTLPDRQAKLAAVQQQLTSLGYVAPAPPSS